MITKEQYLEIAASKYDELESMRGELDFYTYERRMEELVLDLGRLLLEAELGGKTKDSRKKTSSGPASGK